MAAAGIITVVRLWPITELASEFMPDLDEGDLMCLPTALLAVSAGKIQGGHEARRGTPPVVVPVTLAIIVLLLYLNFRNFAEVAMLMASLPFALIGGIWLLYLLDYHLSLPSMSGRSPPMMAATVMTLGRTRRSAPRPRRRSTPAP